VEKNLGKIQFSSISNQKAGGLFGIFTNAFKDNMLMEITF
jgi:hypothetical protein